MKPGGKKPGGKKPAGGAKLRTEAERQLAREKTDSVSAEAFDAARLLHELQVHQVELEMQNIELARQNAALDTARREAEVALGRYQELYDFAPLGYFTLEPSGAIAAANLAGAALLGVERARLINRHFVDFVAAESRGDVEDLMERLVEPGERASALVALQGPQTEARQLHLQGALVEAHEAALPELRLAAIDVTDRVAAEREREILRARLLKTEELESVGRLAGGVAHEFNNMLGVILGYADLALERLEPSHPLFADLLSIREAGERVAALTSRLLAFASRQPYRPRRLELDVAIGTLADVLRRSLGDTIELVVLRSSGLWPIRMDPHQVHQILAELTLNAKQALAGRGRLTLSTANIVVDEDRPGGGPPAGEYVCLTVADTGAGMDEATLRRLFEPFFSTREVGQGTGLGLASVHGIVRQNDGYVEVESEPGRGTSFRLFFPRLVETAGTAPAESPRRAPGDLRRSVLVVEDEPAVLWLVTSMLHRLGYRTLAAKSPAKALLLANKHAGEIDILLTDVVMSGMNGKELAERISVLEPGIATIFMSAYQSDVIARQGLLGGGVRFLQKPFSIGALATEVVEALRSASRA